jgi:hypothetical protein
MSKYRVAFEQKQIKSIRRTTEDIPASETFLEERTGDTIWAIVNADNDDEAREKAERLQVELQTGITKEKLNPRR